MADMMFWDTLSQEHKAALGRIFRDHIDGLLEEMYNDGYEKAWSERGDEFKKDLVRQIRSRVLIFFKEIENE